ncbi:MAG: HAD family hydrolase [Anaerolineae bacterium]
MGLVRAVLFDIGNTLVHYPIRMRWPGMLQDVLAITTAILEDAGEVVPNETILHERAEAENHENPDYSVRPLAGRLARIHGLQPDHPIIPRLVDSFSQYLIHTGKLYPDTIEVLAILQRRGLFVGAVSNLPWGCPALPWRQELERQGLTCYLQVVVYCADVGWRKPAPQPFLRALETLRVKPEESVFIGDDPRWDLAGPRALGMPALVLDRAGTLDLPGERVIHSLSELADML